MHGINIYHLSWAEYFIWGGVGDGECSITCHTCTYILIDSFYSVDQRIWLLFEEYGCHLYYKERTPLYWAAKPPKSKLNRLIYYTQYYNWDRQKKLEEMEQK